MSFSVYNLNDAEPEEFYVIVCANENSCIINKQTGDLLDEMSFSAKFFVI